MGIARRLFGVACIVFGLSHFVYADFTADMIPHWLPLRPGLAYATGAGHLAAGLAILFDIRPRLAATLEALMMSSFVLLVHVPSLLQMPPPGWAPTLRVQLTALFWASALAGSAWIVARSLRDRPWGGARALARCAGGVLAPQEAQHQGFRLAGRGKAQAAVEDPMYQS